MKTELVAAISDHRRPSQPAAIERAVELLEQGEVVAVPTETVYGLAADALRPEAVIKIFEAKERPRFNPLIVHLPDTSWVEKVANVPTRDREIVSNLITAFWPGPFTLVLPKNIAVPHIVTAGLDTVAIRISAHAVFQEIIRRFGKPLAAPSANRFGRVSPTTAQHVLIELDGRIPLIVDGGPTPHGLESTVVSISGGITEILRPGPVTEEDLHAMGCRPSKHQFASDHRPATDATIVGAPGQLPSHYAPTTPLKVVEAATLFTAAANQRVGLLAWNPVTAEDRFGKVRRLSEKQDLREAAANLFRQLRDLDQAGLDLIIAEQVPNEGLGIAINDRLRRAAGSGALPAEP